MAKLCSSPTTISASRGGSIRPKRHRFGKDHHQQRAFALYAAKRSLDLLEQAEEVGRLHNDCGNFVGQLSLQIVEIQPPVLSHTPILQPECLDAWCKSPAPRDIPDEPSARSALCRGCVMRTAIMAASGTAEEPSYMEAFATSMPVNWHTMV